MLRAGAGLPAWLDLGTIGDVAFQEAVGFLVIDLTHMVVTELANFAASAALAAPASLAARSSLRSSMHEYSPLSPAARGLRSDFREDRLSPGMDRNRRP